MVFKVENSLSFLRSYGKKEKKKKGLIQSQGKYIHIIKDKSYFFHFWQFWFSNNIPNKIYYVLFFSLIWHKGSTSLSKGKKYLREGELDLGGGREHSCLFQ